MIFLSIINSTIHLICEIILLANISDSILNYLFFCITSYKLINFRNLRYPYVQLGDYMDRVCMCQNHGNASRIHSFPLVISATFFCATFDNRSIRKKRVRSYNYVVFLSAPYFHVIHFFYSF